MEEVQSERRRGDVLVPPGTIGYLDAISAEGGETVKLHVSSTAPTWRAELVRLYALEIPGFGVERRAEPVDGFEPIEREGIEQVTPIGSYGHAAPLPLDHLESPLTITVTICPTRPGAGPQAVIAQRDEAGVAGWSLGLDPEGKPRLWVATDAGALDLTTPEPLKQGCWYELTATIDAPAGTRVPLRRPRRHLHLQPPGHRPRRRPPRRSRPPRRPAAAAAPLLLAAAALDPNGQPLEGFDGKMESPAIYAAPRGDRGGP